MAADDGTDGEGPPGGSPDGNPTVVRRRSDKPPERIGRYEIVERIGAGAAGVVYLAKDPTIGRQVALKTIFHGSSVDAESGSGVLTGERAFRREAAAAGALVHPNIVTLHDAGRDGNFYYLAMEFIPGINFAEDIRRQSPMPAERVIQVGIDVALALDFAHRRGIVHRDVKPSNLLVLPDQTIKLADLGIAQLSVVENTTQTGTLGTPNYVAPEQISGATIDGRADLFSLGVVLYEALTGRQPFRRETLAATLNAILTETAELPVQPAIPKEIAAIIHRLLRKDPAQRYASGQEVADALAAIEKDAAPGMDRRAAVLLLAGRGSRIGARRDDRDHSTAAESSSRRIGRRHGDPTDRSGRELHRRTCGRRPDHVRCHAVQAARRERREQLDGRGTARCLQYASDPALEGQGLL